MLDLTEEIKRIIKNDSWLRKEIENGWYEHHSHHSPEWYEEMDFAGIYSDKSTEELITLDWHIYADCLREFGIVMFTNDLVTGKLYSDDTRQTVKTLIEQYGLRNVTNEIAKQVLSIRKKLQPLWNGEK